MKRRLAINMFINITAHSWCDGHSTSISACGVWGVMIEIQVFRKKFHTHIHLDYVRVEFLSCIIYYTGIGPPIQGLGP